MRETIVTAPHWAGKDIQFLRDNTIWTRSHKKLMQTKTRQNTVFFPPSLNFPLCRKSHTLPIHPKKFFN